MIYLILSILASTAIFVVFKLFERFKINTLQAIVINYITAIKAKSSINIRQSLWLPFLLFLGSGVIDTSIKYLETTYVPENGIPIFSATIFGCAAIIGILILIIMKLKNTFVFNVKNIFGGIILGIINYFSIFFLLRALQFEGLESSTLFTVNNVAIVMVSTLVGLFLFKESISKKNWFGISLAIISILLVTLA
ncbi:MAG: drug/metabolite transporter (DMT)-like permease [Glaciecola sp.]